MPPTLAGRFLTIGPAGSPQAEIEKGYDEPGRGETDLSKSSDEKKE